MPIAIGRLVYGIIRNKMLIKVNKYILIIKYSPRYPWDYIYSTYKKKEKKEKANTYQQIDYTLVA